jgi:Putative addiction module component
MTESVKERLEKAKGLAPAERASLVGELLATLDEPDGNVESAWRIEVERRIDAATGEKAQAAIPSALLPCSINIDDLTTGKQG